MRDSSRDGRVQKLLDRVRKYFNRAPEPPEDPYAYVGAPKKPRLPRQSASAAADPEP